MTIRFCARRQASDHAIARSVPYKLLVDACSHGQPCAMNRGAQGREGPIVPDPLG